MIRFLGYPADATGDVISLFGECAAAYNYGVTGIIPGYPQSVPTSQLNNPSYGTHIFPDIDTAYAAYTSLGYTFVFFEVGQPSISTFTHPADNVIYCVGSDTGGFGKTIAELQAMGDVFSVDTVFPSNSYHSLLVAMIGMTDRYLRV